MKTIERFFSARFKIILYIPDTSTTVKVYVFKNRILDALFCLVYVIFILNKKVERSELEWFKRVGRGGELKIIPQCVEQPSN